MRPAIWIALAAASACSSAPARAPAPEQPQNTSAPADAAPPDANPNARRVVWSNVATTPGCFYFAGPFDHGTESSYGGSAELVRDGQQMELRFGKLVFRGLENVDGYVLERTAEYKNLESGKRWATTERITGDFDARLLEFRARYSYEECEVGSLDCPGRCEMTADLVVR